MNETILGHTVLTAYREGRDRTARKGSSQMSLGKTQTQRKLLLLDAFSTPSWYPVSKSLYEELRNSTDPRCHSVQTGFHIYSSLLASTVYKHCKQQDKRCWPLPSPMYQEFAFLKTDWRYPDLVDSSSQFSRLSRPSQLHITGLKAPLCLKSL